MKQSPPKILYLDYPRPEGLTYLLPCICHTALIYCVERPECNAFETAILRLIHLGQTEARLIADTLCMDVSLVNYILNALAQRGLLEGDLLRVTTAGMALVSGQETVEPIAKAVSFLTVLGTKHLLQVIMEGALPTYEYVAPKYNDSGRLQQVRFEITENKYCHAKVLFSSTEETPPPDTASVYALMQRLNNERRRGRLRRSIPFLRTSATAHRGINVQKDSAMLCYVPLTLRLDDLNQQIIAEDPFGRGSSAEMLSLLHDLGAANTCFQSLLAWKEERLHSKERIFVKGADADFHRLYPTLAKEFAIAQHSGKDAATRITATYSALEWAFHGILSDNDRRIAYARLTGTEENRLQTLQEACHTLHFSYPEGHNMLTRVSPSRLNAYCSAPDNPVLPIVLACCIIAATADPAHPLRRVGASTPGLLADLTRLHHQRNLASHGNLPSDAYVNNVQAFLEVIRTLYFQHFSVSTPTETPYYHSEKQARITALRRIVERLGNELCDKLKQEHPRVFRALLLALQAEAHQHLDLAVKEFCIAIQHILRAGYKRCQGEYSVAPAPLSYDDIAKKCTHCGLLAAESALPESIRTVRREMYENLILYGRDTTLGASLLAWLTSANESVLLAVAGSASAGILYDVASLCDLRGHGNGRNVSIDAWQELTQRMFTPNYLSSLIH